MFLFKLKQVLRSIWFRPTAYAIAAILTVLITPVTSRFIPTEWVLAIDRQALTTSLNILASSMLAVAIFSLATMFSAFQAAAQSATPRARPLLSEDNTAQSAVSTFIGAFLFSLLALIGVTSGYYAEAGLLVVFVLTLLMVINVVVMLIRWIERLTSFGGVEEAILSVEAATRRALEREWKCPNLGARSAHSPPDNSVAIQPVSPGFIQTVDIPKLQAIAKAAGVEIHLSARPGHYVGPGHPVAWVASEHQGLKADICSAMVISEARNMDEDPAFGLIAISEIASRALSTSVNDPGTAISAIAANTRLLCACAGRFRAEAENPAANVSIIPIDLSAWLTYAYRSIARDGAPYVEVGIKLQKALGMLKAADADLFGTHVKTVSEDALNRAESAISHDADLKALKAVARGI
jgi:uncharacterized membrane protein